MLSNEFLDELYDTYQIQSVEMKYETAGKPFREDFEQVATMIVRDAPNPKAKAFVEAIATLLLQRLDEHLKKPAKTKSGRFLRCAWNFLTTLKWKQ